MKTAMHTEILEQRFLKSFGHLFTGAGLRGAEGESFSAILQSVTYRFLETGTVLMQPGAVCRQLPMVISGSIRVYKTTEGGREITLYRIGAGQSCILSSNCGSGPMSFPATAVAEAPTAAAFLPDLRVASLIAEDPAFRGFIMDQYARRVVEVMELVEEVAFRKVDSRLHELLSAQTAATDGSVHLTHRKLADHVGTSREVVSRILKDWELRGLVRLGRSNIEVLDGFRSMVF